MPTTAPITAIIAPVPEAQSLVGDLRVRFDDTTALGVPPHVTILAPFMAPEAVTHEVLASLREAISSVKAFRFTLTGARRWPEAAWLAPEPATSFVELICNVVSRFPAFPPYEGRHDKIIPHLTVAHGSHEAADLAEAELQTLLREKGPIQAFCGHLSLLENSSGKWKKILDLPLAT
ncbi:2'-5' RNA ligase family protein [Uliginosibacterium sp. H3]|uniref:2'-5' RNA ligase family protein n=1 Tax=Uliginosibacterium silvisoli TaxID=3114758 RepID=A0ABU6K6L0_9RHOO|nr:2'-5' RNA ligase family protein [Uliginosibacterium sp. H3]